MVNADDSSLQADSQCFSVGLVWWSVISGRSVCIHHVTQVNSSSGRGQDDSTVDTRALQPVATCRQSPYLHEPAIVIVTSFSLSRRSQPPFPLWRHSHCDVIRYWAGHAHRCGRTYVTDTLPRLIYKDIVGVERSEISCCGRFYFRIALTYLIRAHERCRHTYR